MSRNFNKMSMKDLFFRTKKENSTDRRGLCILDYKIIPIYKHFSPCVKFFFKFNIFLPDCDLKYKKKKKKKNTN